MVRQNEHKMFQFHPFENMHQPFQIRRLPIQKNKKSSTATQHYSVDIA